MYFQTALRPGYLPESLTPATMSVASDRWLRNPDQRGRVVRSYAWTCTENGTLTGQRYNEGYVGSYDPSNSPAQRISASDLPKV